MTKEISHEREKKLALSFRSNRSIKNSSKTECNTSNYGINDASQQETGKQKKKLSQRNQE